MIRTAIASLLASVGMVHASSAATFGELPLGAISTNVVKDVHAEICRDHLVDPAAINARLPEGYRLTLATEHAQAEPDLAAFLKAADQKYSRYAVASLCFMSVGTFAVDGVQLAPGATTPMAFWWVRATGPRDTRMQGKVEWLQLASWYARDIPHRDKVIATDPMAQFVDIKVQQTRPGQWSISVVLARETIEADVTVDGPRKKRGAPEPGFMSVPFSGKAAGSFWVITYFGHHHQQAKGQWRAKGGGVFGNAFAVPGEAKVFDTFFQNGWSALSGLYK